MSRQPSESFELLEHTADIGLKAYGQTLKEAFENAAYGMFSMITDLERVETRETIEVQVEAIDAEALLVAWLNELIYLSDARTLVLKSFNISEWDEENYLKASVRGEPVDLSRHSIEVQIKACTYHMLMIDKNSRYAVQVVFDV